MKCPTRGARLRQGFGVIAVMLMTLLASSACRQDMHDQPKYRPLRESAFFANTSSARPLVEGTIARGTLQTDAAFFTGKNGALFVNELPFPATAEVLARGEERFNVYCTPCHGMTGAGNGMVVQRGYPAPPSFHIDRLRNIEAGYFFDVMTNGFGRMPDYRAQVTPRDRWNIVAYIRALQLAERAPADDVKRAREIEQQKPAPATAKPTGHQ
jgi:mono/diheme cytochrome c family protein